VGEIKKRRYVYYHCSGYRGKCEEPYTREETLRDQFVRALQNMELPPPVLQWLEQESGRWEDRRRTAHRDDLKRHQADLERLQRRLETMYEDRLQGRLDTATYDRKAADVREQTEQAQSRIAEIQAKLAMPTLETIELAELIQRAAELFLGQSRAEQRKLLRLIWKQGSWKDGVLRITMRQPFEGFRRAAF
jgi:hypothetical protein